MERHHATKFRKKSPIDWKSLIAEALDPLPLYVYEITGYHLLVLLHAY
jgi:hypothetical protein